VCVGFISVEVSKLVALCVGVGVLCWCECVGAVCDILRLPSLFIIWRL